MSEKFCIDCKHYLAEPYTVEQCRHKPIGQNILLGQWLVAGEGARPGVAYYSCAVERASKGDIYCGPEAKHFEAKEAGDRKSTRLNSSH